MPPRELPPRAWIALVAVAAAIVGLRNDFVYDDILLLLHDPRMLSVGGWSQFFTTAYWPQPHEQDLYRPLASVFMAAQYLISAGGPLVFRIVSLLLYVAASVGVYQVARRISNPAVAMA